MSQDNISADLVATRKGREASERAALLGEFHQLMAKEEKAKAAAPVAPAAAAGSKPKAATGTTVGTAIQDSASAVVYAGAGLVDSVGGMVNDAVNVFTDRMFDYRFNSPDLTGALENAGLSKPVTIGGKLGKDILQWAMPFTGALKAANAAGNVTKTAKASTKVATSMAAGAAADVVAFGPEEKRLSDMLVGLGDQYPMLKNPLTEFLASEEDDSHGEARLKNVLEGAALGGAVEGVFGLIKASKSLFKANGKDVVKAIEESTTEAADLTAHAMDTSKAPDLSVQKQIDLVAGVKSPDGAAKWQKYLDVKAAADADAAAKGATPAPHDPTTPGYDPNLLKNAEDIDPLSGKPIDQAAKNDATIAATMAAHEAELAKGAVPHKVMMDADGSMSLSKEAPEGAQVDMDTAVADILRPGYSKTLMDDAAAVPVQQADPISASAYNGERIGAELRQEQLEAYRALQEAALGKKVTPKTPKAKKGAAKKAAPAAKAAPKAAPATKTVAPEVGDTVTWGGGRESGEVVGIGKTGKVMIIDDRTGAKMAVTPDAEDALVAEIKANDKAIKAKAGKKQSGHIDPSLLIQLGSAQAGAVAGWMSAEDDASLADKLSLAGFGAMAGFGIARVGTNKVMTAADRKAIAEASPELEALARPEVRNIAPMEPLAKKPPVIAKAKVNQIVEAAKAGKISDLAATAKEADFNFDHIDTAEDVADMVNSFSAVFEKEISHAKHGVQTFGDIKELADEVGSGVNSLKELYSDTDNLSARVLSHRILLAASAEQVNKLARLAMTGDADAILSMRKHVALHASIQGQVKGIQTEVARALGQFRISASSVDLSFNERNILIEAMGGHKANMDFAEKLSMITDPKKLAAITRRGSLARNQDALYEAWINGLLSSPVTHMVNVMGNTLVAIASPAERLAAAAIGTVLNGSDAAIKRGEATAYLFGMMEGLKDTLRITKEGMDALKTAGGTAVRGDFKGAKEVLRDNRDEFGSSWNAFATDMPVLDNMAFGTREFDKQEPAISAAAFNIEVNGVLGHLVDGLGTVLRTPGRMLTTADELFKSIHYRGELKAQAYRIASGEGLTGEAKFQRIVDLIENPTPDLSTQALQAARIGTFTSPLGKGGLMLQGAVQATPGARYIMPFIRTPVNIMKYAGVRTPGLNLLAESVRTELKAGGARRDMVLAKTAIGGSLYALGATLAAQGLITGGGEKDKSAEKLGGIMPYAVKIGDKYYAYNRADPFGMFLGLAADVTAISGQVDEATVGDLASASVLALSRNVVSKSYLSGLVSLIEGITNPETHGEAFIQKFASSFVPLSAMSGVVRREEDPLVREVWSITDAVMNKIPGLSKSLPPRLNIFGEEVKYGGGLGPDWVSPIYTAEASTEPAAKEIARLNLDLRAPPKAIGGGSGMPGIDLTAVQYHRLMQLVGEGFKPDVTEMVASKDYQELPEDPSNTVYVEAKEKSIRMLYEAHKRAAVAKLLEEDQSLMQKFELNRQNAGNAMSGLEIFQMPK